VVVPAQVNAGASFQVNITTYGGGCERQGETEVSVSQQTRIADVTPYDETNVAAEVCTQELKMFSHTATVRFEQPGTAVVRVHGVRLQDNAPVTVTRTVEVVAPGS
jgi:3,4-dihydroxy-2-butanone 4-phosphate synthase